MRTREIKTLSPSIEAQNTLSKDTNNALKEFNHRTQNLLINPLSEFGNKAITILDMKNTTKDEETTMRLGQMFGIKNKKLWEIITNDRENTQVSRMLAQVGLGLHSHADDYKKLAIAA